MQLQQLLTPGGSCLQVYMVIGFAVTLGVILLVLGSYYFGR